MNKNIKIMASASALALVAMAVVTMGSSPRFDSLGIVNANNETPYSLNLTGLSASNDILQTNNGNNIYFHVGKYSDMTFASGGGFRNGTAISGIQSLSIEFVTNDADLTVEYGWADYTYDVDDGIINSSNPTYTFGGEAPSHFRITNNTGSPIEVSSIVVTYTCEASTKPDKYLLSYFHNYPSGYWVESCAKTATEVVIPSTYKGEDVIAISQNAFENCTSLTSVTIPNTVRFIGSSAFAGCTSLGSITLPDSVTDLGGSAFWNCSALASINIPENLASIDSHAFDLCSSLNSISVDSNNTVFSMRDGILYNESTKNCLVCEKSKTGSVSIPNDATSIDERAFESCSAITSTTIPASVTSVGSYAFQGCSLLRSVTFANASTTLGDTVFAECSSLSDISLPSGLTSVGYRLFAECTSLTAISLPSTITNIGMSAFSGCSSLASFNIPSSVKSIGGGAFSDCIALESIFIPNSVETMGSDVFYNDEKTLTIRCQATERPAGWDAEWNGTGFVGVTVPVEWGCAN